MTKYQHSIQVVQNNNGMLNNDGSSSQLYLTLVELKTLLDSYDSASGNIKALYKQKFLLLANNSVQIVNEILPMGIRSGLKFSSVN